MKGAPTPWSRTTIRKREKNFAHLVTTRNTEPRTVVQIVTGKTVDAKSVIRLNPSPFEALTNPVPVVPKMVLREDCGCFEDDSNTELESIP